MTRVCVASRSFSRHPVLRQELLSKFPDVTFNDQGTSLTDQGLIDFVSGHSHAITALEKLDATFFNALPDLKIVSKYGVGFDMIDVTAMKQAGVYLGWTGGSNKRSVSELVIAYALNMLRHIPVLNADVKSGSWQQIKGQQLTGKTVGIIGFGHVGKDLAVLLQAFGCEVLAHDILNFPDFCQTHDIPQTDLNNLLNQSDIVTLHLPLDDSTKNILGPEQLKIMKPGSLLINAARGGLVDETAVKNALQSGQLSGAAFDVFSCEPPEDIDLIKLANFLVTPHIGGSTDEAILAMGRAAIAGLRNNQIPEVGVFPK